MHTIYLRSWSLQRVVEVTREWVSSIIVRPLNPGRKRKMLTNIMVLLYACINRDSYELPSQFCALTDPNLFLFAVTISEAAIEAAQSTGRTSMSWAPVPCSSWPVRACPATGGTPFLYSPSGASSATTGGCTGAGWTLDKRPPKIREPTSPLLVRFFF